MMASKASQNLNCRAGYKLLKREQQSNYIITRGGIRLPRINWSVLGGWWTMLVTMLLLQNGDKESFYARA